MSRMDEEKFKKIEFKKGANPFEVFNEKFHTQHICKGSKNFEPAVEGKDIIEKGGNVAFEHNSDRGHYYTVINDNGWQKGKLYSPYKLLTLIAFGGHERRAQTFVRREYMNQGFPYILCGTNYFKQINKTNRWGIETEQLKGFNRQTLKDLEGSKGLNHVLQNAVYDDFTIEPSNTNYNQVVDGKWNLYNNFPHTPHPQPVNIDDIPVTANFMAHVFGQQLETGWKYIKVLYERPKQILPVLVLVSEERGTGKTTFLDWLHILFGSNFGIASPEDLKSQFNSHYARKNIVAIDESVIDKKQSVEKIKSLSTAKQIQVNEKNIAQYNIPFYAKWVMATNKVKDFMRIDSEEIRFWIRKLPEIPDDEVIDDFYDNIIEEIPKFLRYLKDSIDVEYGRSRMVFTYSEIHNTDLKAVKVESRSGLHKELETLIQEWYKDNPAAEALYMRLKDIKDGWFQYDNKISAHYIKKVLTEQMEIQPQPMGRYKMMGGEVSRPGQPYLFKRRNFTDIEAEQAESESEEDYPF